MAKFIVYDDDHNELDDVIYDSPEDLLRQIKRHAVNYLLRRREFQKLLPEQNQGFVHTPFPSDEEVDAVDNPCEICESRTNCLLDSACEYGALVWELPDRIQFDVSADFFKGLSLVQDVLAKLPGVKSWHVTLACGGKLIEGE